MNKKFLILIIYLIIFSDALAGKNDEIESANTRQKTSFRFEPNSEAEKLTYRQWGLVAASGGACAIGVLSALLSDEQQDLAIASFATVWASTSVSTIVWYSATLYNLYIEYKKAIKAAEEASV